MPDSLVVSPSAFSSKGHWTNEQLKLTFAFYCQTPFGNGPKIS
jgi:putative restriction endonuclease